MIVPEACERWIRVQRPQGDYLKELELDFLMIEPHLPESVESILDIGCGMAGIDVYLKSKYPNARIELLDGDGDLHPTYGFNRRCKPYNSRQATEELLKANGVNIDRWHDIGTKEELKADLVISLISWGFHYPLSMYKVAGLCIADLRREYEEPRGEIIHQALKYDRCLFAC